MLIGILSDTHDRVDNAIAGINLLVQGGAEFLIHCGDVGGEHVIDQLAGHRSALVWGNNDWDRRGLARYAQALQIQVFEHLGELELDGKKFAITHGDDPKLVRAIIQRQQHDYLLVGHSHVKHDQRFDRVRLINPGALHRAAEKSVALLDTSDDSLQFLLL